jgi:integrase
MDSDEITVVTHESLATRAERIRSAAKRRLATYLPNRALSARWQNQIERAYRALIEETVQTGEPLDVILETRSSISAIRVGKYCVRHFETLALAELQTRLETLDAHDPSGDIDAILAQIETSLMRLEQAEIANQPTEPKCRRRATRLRLHPADWQDKLIAGAPPKLKIALLILALTGCRPCELSRGIEFLIGPPWSDVRLTLDIAGAKCDQYRGQPSRTFQFLAEDLRSRVTELVDALRDYQTGKSAASFRASEINTRIYQRSRELWPGHKPLPSAYSFRYAFREQMARLGATRAEIARAMGHRSMLSSLAYGRQMQRQRTQDLAFDISASFEPHYPDRYHLEYAERWQDDKGPARLLARDITCDLYLDHLA